VIMATIGIPPARKNGNTRYCKIVGR
jgi:hypothetical protein